jgi:hypothetical protein
MPYIPEECRKTLDPGCIEYVAETPGELNFQFTALSIQYIQQNGGLSYNTLNEVVGALECAKLELYRRIGAAYEDVKAVQNGDVYPKEL